MKRITVYFTFATLAEVEHFRRLLTEAHWLEPSDDAVQDYDVIVRIDAGNYELLGKMIELASDVRSRWPRS